MNKRIVTLLLSIVMMCSLLVTAVPAWAAGNDSGVTASASTASPGSTFSVTLKVPKTTEKISDMSLKVHFDKNVFEVTEYTVPTINGMNHMYSDPADANNNGFFSAAYYTPTGDADIKFDGLELTAQFKVKDGAALGNSEFYLDENIKVPEEGKQRKSCHRYGQSRRAHRIPCYIAHIPCSRYGRADPYNNMYGVRLFFHLLCEDEPDASARYKL